MADIYQGGITRYFGDVVENIESYMEHNAANLVNNVHKALIDGTPRDTNSGTPVDTGALKWNWHTGIRPNSNRVDRKRGTYYPQPEAETKLYGIHYTYYIWNNSPYLELVNKGITRAGDSPTPRSSVNVRFIQKAIAIGEKNANAT